MAVPPVKWASAVQTQLFQSTNSASLPALIRMAGFCSGKTLNRLHHRVVGCSLRILARGEMQNDFAVRVWNDVAE